MVIERADWGRLDALLVAALDLTGEARAAFLAKECAGEPGLEDQLRELIRLAESDTGLSPSMLRQTDPSGGPAAPGPPLAPGSILGRYEIREVLGSGGQGHVYCALDPSLDREVAIKALAGAFQGDPANLRRFEREARVLAALSHPNIAAIYGFERIDGAPYLVLEKIDGGTLAQRIARGPLPVKEALSIAIQVAEGLAEAHGKEVVHRDLKPSNVMLSPEGRVKLVDFGLAKSTATRTRSVSSNLTTMVGAVVGTAPYMSPEQIQGDELDARTDLWAFGCLLFEMLTGRAAFSGRTLAEVVAAVLRDEPDFATLPGATPPELRKVIERCLRKDQNLRLRSISDVRIELVDLQTAVSVPMLRDSGATSLVGKPTTKANRFRSGVAFGAGAALLLALLAGVVISRLPSRKTARPDVASPFALSLELPSGVALSTEYSPPFALSPSGSHAVVVAADAESTKLYVRALDSVALRVLPGTEDARQPCVSPDGRSVAYFADRKLKRIPLDGGTPLPLWDFGSNSRGAAWPREGTLVVSPSQTSGLVSVPDGGGKPTPLTALDSAHGERSHRWPEGVPGGPWVLFTVGFEGASYDEGRIDAVSLDTRERKTILSQAAFGRVLPGGRLLFVRGGRVHAVELDPVTLKTSGVPEAVLAGVRYDPQNGAAHLAVSVSGAVVYGPAAPVSPETYLSFLDSAGKLTRLSETPRLFRDPRLSADGRKVAVVIGTSTESDLFVVDERGTISQLTFKLSPHRPVFRPSDGSIAVGAESGGTWKLLSVAADGKGAPRVLYEGSRRVYPDAWSPDGRSLVFQEDRAETGWDLLVLEVDGDGVPVGSPRPLADTPFHETNAMLSPDGAWIAYESDELDALVQAYVRAFPGGGGKVRASTSGARWPAWGRGDRLFFWDTSSHRLASIGSRAEGDHLVFEESAPVFAPGAAPAPITISVTGARFDVVGAGERFLVLEKSVPPHEPVLTRPVLLLDWDPLRSPR